MGAATLRRKGDAMLLLIVRDSMVMAGRGERGVVEDGVSKWLVQQKTAPRQLSGIRSTLSMGQSNLRASTNRPTIYSAHGNRKRRLEHMNFSPSGYIL
tara:strand:+ start:19677 stop:19970 length:294 start_codon:yes stop_codon:yes gene_type:complete